MGKTFRTFALHGMNEQEALALLEGFSSDGKVPRLPGDKDDERETMGVPIAQPGYRHMVEICVRDQGIGIPQVHLERIFDRFHRVDTRLTREVNGLGLGLAICKRIVELHHGVIWAESDIGTGSTFHVWLPMEVPAPSLRSFVKG